MTRTRFHRPSSSTVRILAMGGLTLTLLGGCASSPKSDGAEAPPLATQKWESKVQVDSHPDEVLLSLHAEGLSPNQAQAVDGLLGRWLAAEAREITVSAPMGGPDGEIAGRMAVAARQRLIAMGAPAAKVHIVGYDAGGAAGAPLKVGFLRFEAVVPKCGSWENLTATRKNESYGNFGCAVAANMAAQVANPEDLLGPRDTTPVDAARRDTVFGKYRAGETSSSAKDEQATGVISKAVN